MIELFACTPLLASITRQQCAINRGQEHMIFCRACAGLGALVETVEGTPAARPEGRGKAPAVYGRAGAASRARTMRERAITRDRILGGGLPLELVDRPVSVSFDVIDADDLAMLRRVEACAYSCGSTLGDEILCRLSVLDSLL